MLKLNYYLLVNFSISVIKINTFTDSLPTISVFVSCLYLRSTYFSSKSYAFSKRAVFSWVKFCFATTIASTSSEISPKQPS